MSALASLTSPAVARPALQPARRVSVGKSGGVIPVQFPDARAWRAAFQHNWTEYLHANYQNHVLVAAVFYVSEKTARQWWEGVTAPQGWAVDYATQVLQFKLPAGGK